ncbi:hypothetical protein U0070_023970, partial [Myodes glareolus]
VEPLGGACRAAVPGGPRGGRVTAVRRPALARSLGGRAGCRRDDCPAAGPGAAAAAAAARERRQEQLRQWGARAGAEPGPGERRARTVRFERAAEFLAACAGGDLDEARLMLRAADSGPGSGAASDPSVSPSARAVLDSTNADGISALHQACIDENLEVVRFLVEQGATVNQADNEGWTPLHVAASCGYLDIARYLLSHGANIAAVNSDGDLPLDLAESDAMEGLLKAEIARRGVDVEAAKRAEEELLLHDTRCWLNGGAMPEARHPRTGASALHVAAAKGYIEVMRLLLQAGYDTELRDGDGWTPLHAAAHWGVEDACRLLAEHGGGMDSLTHAGQRPCDLADEEVMNLLEELAQKQEDLRNQKEASQSQGQEPQVPSNSKHRRSSVCRLSSREKISLQDLSKERRPGGAGGPPIRDEDEGEEAPADHQPMEPRALNGVTSPVSSSPKSPVMPEEAPFSRRFGLQKTGSSGALGPSERRGAEGVLGLQRSASSSLLEKASSQAREPRLARITPTPAQKVPEPSALPLCSNCLRAFALPVESLELAWISFFTSACLPPFSRAQWDCLANMNSVHVPGLFCFFSPSTFSRHAPHLPFWLLFVMCEAAMPPSLDHSAPPTRREPGSPVKPNVLTASAAPLTDSRDRRRSYQMPVRDEESESQRKARSRLMRQSRRSTQGVTLTDLKEAEKVAGKTPEPDQPVPSSLDPSWRPRVPGVENAEGPAQRAEAPDGQGQGPQAAREHRKVGHERRGPAEGEEAGPAERSLEYSTVDGNSTARRQRSQRDLNPESKQEHEEPDGSFRKLYMELRRENERLREALTETTLKLAQLKVELERATQRQERFAERPALLELERFERRALERKAAELEEELKALSDLRADNQRLKDENAALIRNREESTESPRTKGGPLRPGWRWEAEPGREMLLRVGRHQKWDQEGKQGPRNTRSVSRSRVDAPGPHLTCDATLHSSPSPAGIQECAKSPTGLCQVGLYIGSMCNREGCLLFLLPPSHPLSGEGEKVFLRQSTGTTNKVVTLPLSDLSTSGHSKWKKPVAERGWAEMQSGWRHEAFERKTPGFKYQVKEQNSEEPGKDFEHEKVCLSAPPHCPFPLVGGFQSAQSVQSARWVSGEDQVGRSFRTSIATGDGEEFGDCCLRGRWEPRHLIMFCERARKDQITSVLASPSTFFFCFSITASSSDTFSLSARCTVTWLYTRAPSSGHTARNSSFCSEKSCAPVRTPRASTVLSK